MLYDTYSFLLPYLNFHVFSAFIAHCMINTILRHEKFLVELMALVELMILFSKMIHQLVKYCWVTTTKVKNKSILLFDELIFIF